MNRRGFTLIELLVAIVIMAVLVILAAVAYAPVRRNANDDLRLSTINEVGRLLLSDGCYTPNAGTGDYDIKVIYDEIVANQPKVKQYISAPPQDPKTGAGYQTNYRYIYNAAGGGNGSFESTTIGPNGTNRYYQISR
jgi:prepilin-type N-terminal cleavage/methylation domain-containing protein